MSEVRGRSWEDPMPEGRGPRGVTPCLRSGAAAESARLRRRRNCREELPHVQGQGWRPRGATPCPRPGRQPGGTHAQRAVAKRSYPTSEVRGSGRECQAATAQKRPRGATQIRGQGRRPGGATHVQGAVASLVQEGLLLLLLSRFSRLRLCATP